MCPPSAAQRSFKKKTQWCVLLRFISRHLYNNASLHAEVHLSVKRVSSISAVRICYTQPNYPGSSQSTLKDESLDENSKTWLRSGFVWSTGTASRMKAKWRISNAPTYHLNLSTQWLTSMTFVFLITVSSNSLIATSSDLHFSGLACVLHVRP